MLEKIIKYKNLIYTKRKMLKYKILFLNRNREEIRISFSNQEKIGINKIPIFILSFNRLSYLKKIIRYLEKCGYTNIYIIDNMSTFPPLIEYYKTIPYNIIYLNENLGHLAFWKSKLFDKYRNNFYVLTDPDVLPIEDCPNDFLEKFFYCLKKYPFMRKVGFSLKIDDLPSDTIFFKDIYNWEKQFYNYPINNSKLYYAPIDTTFALYLPDKFCKGIEYSRAIRTAYPYTARHLPWYKKINELAEEDFYYSNKKNNGWWDPVKGLTKD